MKTQIEASSETQMETKTHQRETGSNAPRLDSDVDLLAYLSALLRAKFMIIGMAIVFGVVAAGYSYTLPEMYETYVRSDLVDVEDPGGVSPDNRRASEVLTLVEHGFILGTSKDNYLDVTLAKMRSRQFSLMFIEKHGVFQAFYPEQWDETAQSWTPGFTPDRGSSFTLFNERVRFIDHNPENDIISVRMRWSDPVLARDWANAYVKEFNQFMREQALKDVEKKRGFLEQELQRTTVVDIRQSIFRLIEAQTAVAMLASAKEEYVLEVIDPALLPFERYSPGRRTYLVLGSFAGGMLAVAMVFGQLIFNNMRAALSKHELYPTLYKENISYRKDRGQETSRA